MKLPTHNGFSLPPHLKPLQERLLASLVSFSSTRFLFRFIICNADSPHSYVSLHLVSFPSSSSMSSLLDFALRLRTTNHADMMASLSRDRVRNRVSSCISAAIRFIGMLDANGLKMSSMTETSRPRIFL